MTRAEFEENITSWYDLIDFCYENDLHSCDNIYDSEQVVEIIRDEARSEGVRGVCWLVNNIYDFDAEYFYYGENGLVSLDNSDFERYKSDVFTEFEDYFDDEDDEEDYFEDENYIERDIDEPIEESLFYAILQAS